MWSDDEKRKLRDLTIDPARHSREKLIALVEHFKRGGSLYSVTDNGEPVYASQDFARKMRRGTEDEELSWLLGQDQPRSSRDENAEQAERHHWPELRACARELYEKVCSGVPLAQLLGFPWQIFPDYTGALIIRFDDGDFEVSLSGESSLLVQALRQHMPSDEAWGNLDRWRSAVGELEDGLRHLVDWATQQPETGRKTWISQDDVYEGQEGITNFFALTAVLDGVEGACAIPGAHQGYELQPLSGKRLWTLRWVRNYSSFVIIAASREDEGLQTFIQQHSKLREKLLNEIEASGVQLRYRQVLEAKQALASSLRHIPHLATLPGICTLYGR